MRKMKFRAWDKEVNKMVIPPTIDNPEEEDDEWVLMQFTGLLDKNGKEIYEGDIYKCEGSDLRVIRYDEDGTWSYSYSINEFGNVPEKEWEVIGNCWEHPELLKE